MATSYTIADVFYPSKKAVRERCSQILRKGEGVITDRDDLLFVCGLLLMHHNREEKERGGVTGFAVLPSGYGPNARGFWIRQTSGAYLDFGIEACLGPPNARRSINRACRTAILPDIRAYRDSLTWPRFCAVSGEPIDRDDHHVDHAPPFLFNVIVDAFLVLYPDPPVADEGTFYRFAEEVHTDAFREFHNARAVLRAVSAKTNLSLPKDPK